MDKTKPTAPSPAVDLGEPDMVVHLGSHAFMLFSQSIRQKGMIGYPYLLVVVGDDGKAVLWVCAETNPMDGPSKFYLGVFDHHGHQTLGDSPLIGEPAFFLPAAFAVARKLLGLSYADYPVTDTEMANIGGIPAVLEKHYPDGGVDQFTYDVMAMLMEAVGD